MLRSTYNVQLVKLDTIAHPENIVDKLYDDTGYFIFPYYDNNNSIYERPI